MSAIEILPIEVLRTLPTAGDFDAGLYFLWKGDELLYIGKSQQICVRLVTHAIYPKIPNNRHTCLILNSDPFISSYLKMKMDPLERAYIAHYNPPFNLMYTADWKAKG